MSTPPPLSSSSSSTNSPSPITPNTELKADPSDTLEFLLQTMAQAQAHAHTQHGSDSSFDSSHEPDWTQLSTWTQPPAQEHKFDLSSDFSFSLPMDLDFDQNMAVDPSALHFTSIFDQAAFAVPPSEGSFLMGNEMVANNDGNSNNNHTLYAGEEASWPPAHLQPRTGRRLSITSSSSSSGASLSPVMEPTASVSSSPPSEVILGDPASELAQRVRQMAGVTWAVPVSAQVQQLAAAGGQAKLPIPRLKQTPTPAPAPKRVPKTSPPPEGDLSASSSSTPSSDQAQSPPSDAPSGAPTQSVIGRPKTSHTTIERRYRTNLNARITGLKHSVPALRVLEIKAGEQSPYNDVVDTRGFVDGVKVARKMSKANILGKATEYIRVLKKREARLKREQDGLKSLVSGLVGGPALLKEWEREWRERFGGEEKDEIEDDDAGSDDDEGEGDDSDGEDEEGRARKKPKVTKPAKKEKPYRPPPPPPVPGVPGAVPEKRKRGRPRKIPLPPTPVPSANQSPIVPSNPATMSTVFSAEPPLQEPFMQATPQPPTQSQPTQQYLLAVFAFFSVFNSPLTSSHRSHASPPHTHHGSVLIPHTPTETQVPVHAPSSYGLHEVVQAVHLLVSTLVFFYVLVPWLSGALQKSGVLARLTTFFMRAGKDVPPAAATPADVKQKASTRATMMAALSPAARGMHEEPARLRAALGVSTGVVGLLQSVIKAARKDRGIELNQLEQRAWVRLGELVAFDGTVGATTRLQTFWCMSWHISTFAASTTDISTLALIIRPVYPSKATELWERARQREFLRAHETIVLNNLTVEAAADWLAKWRQWHETGRKGRCTACEKRTPLGVLAAILIRERLRKHAAALFVRTVVSAEVAARRAAAAAYGGEDVSDDEDEDKDGMLLERYNAEKDFREEQERRETLDAGKSIGGRTAALAVVLERIWDAGFRPADDALDTSASASTLDADADIDAGMDCEDAADLASQDEAEIRALLSATLLYRRVFPSAIAACASASGVAAFVLSPPPSPPMSGKDARVHAALRTALGSPAFEAGVGGRALEDAELGAALEDARDRVVDMLVDCEKAWRRGGRAFE